MTDGQSIPTKMREVQEEAFRRGMIPYVPADRGETDEEDDEER